MGLRTRLLWGGFVFSYDAWVFCPFFLRRVGGLRTHRVPIPRPEVTLAEGLTGRVE